MTTDTRPELTPKQRAVYQYLWNHIEKHQTAPSVREICKAFGWKSPNGAMCHLGALVKKGYLERDRFEARRIRIAGHCCKLIPIEE